MQTFLPAASLQDSVYLLDWRRLGKQRSEAAMVYNALATHTGWYHHPAVQMWRGYEVALAIYHNLVIDEWVRRGYQNNMPHIAVSGTVVYPPWFGGAIHTSHRAALLFKSARSLYEAPELTPKYDRALVEYDWYRQFGWKEEPLADDVRQYKEFPYYYWPTK